MRNLLHDLQALTAHDIFNIFPAMDENGSTTVLDRSKTVYMQLAYAVKLMSVPIKPALELFLMSKTT